jgi:hypothetical protein
MQKEAKLCRARIARGPEESTAHAAAREFAKQGAKSCGARGVEGIGTAAIQP